MMKKTFLIFCFSYLLLLCSSCLKGDEGCVPKTVQSEEGQMQAYASSNGITPTVHTSGLYYQIINAGTGAPPTLTSNVSVKYTGKLTNGTIFGQSSTPLTLSLSTVIAGWQIGIPLIGEGGVIKLIIPSSLAYGCVANGSIPANSVLFFEVELVDIL